MDIKIYQINLERDGNQVAFMSHDRLPRFQGTDQIDSSIYDLVFSGDVSCNSLEDVYQMFNIDRPEGYTGRSLSVSDVVQVQDSSANEPRFYFCDSFGFKEVQFDSELTHDVSKPSTIKVVFVEPGKLARTAEIDSSLEGLQKAVKGSIEAFYPFEEEVCIVCNEEGKINGLPLNRAVYMDVVEEFELSYEDMAQRFRSQERSGTGRHLTGYIVFTEDSFDKPYSVEERTYVVSSDNKAFKPNMGGYSIYARSLDGKDPLVRLEAYMADEHGGKDGWKIERCYFKNNEKEMVDIIAGPFIVCDCSGERFGSLSEEQLKRYTEMFKRPERFAQIGGEIVTFPYTPNKNHER